MKNKDLTLKWFDKSKEKYAANPKNNVLRHALSSTNFNDVFRNLDNAENNENDNKLFQPNNKEDDKVLLTIQQPKKNKK